MGSFGYYRNVGAYLAPSKEKKTMKQITISMELGKIEATAVWNDGELVIKLGSLQIDPLTHGNYMTAEQISGFLDSVVWPRLNGMSREIETEQNEKEEAEMEKEEAEPEGEE